MDYSRLLSDEHKAIRHAVDVLNAMTARAERNEQVDIHDVNALLMFLHYFGDVCHQAKEETILFPALQSSEGFASSFEPGALLTGHNEERALIEQAQLTLFTDNHSEFVANAQRLIKVLSEHLTKEETVVFPLAEQILTREKAMEIGYRMEEADANFGYTQRKLLLDLLQQLADKYIRKAA